MTDIDTLLHANPAPTVRGSLSSDILAAAETVAPANDMAPWRSWWSFGAVAAMAVMTAIFIIQPVSDPAADWEQLADGSGFSDLYEWVEDTDS